MADIMVSVLMTSYNREKYIGPAIESVLASTFTNFELIITDDGSKDDTVSIANTYSAKDKRVKVFVNKFNLGDYPNRNRAASHASGKYLKYVDADDLIYPWGLELLVSMMEQFQNAGWGLCSLVQDSQQLFPFLLDPKEAYQYHYTGPGLFHKAPLSSIIRKDVFDSVGGFSNLRMVGDFEMWHKLAQKYSVVLMPQGIVWYRVHGEQEMKSYNNFVSEYEKIKIAYLNSDDCPLSVEFRNKILLKEKRQLIKKLFIESIRLHGSSIKTVLKQLKEYK